MIIYFFKKSIMQRIFFSKVIKKKGKKISILDCSKQTKNRCLLLAGELNTCSFYDENRSNAIKYKQTPHYQGGT